MSNALEEVSVTCPYCFEIITVVVDCSVAKQSYIEDCEVCCQPICLNITTGENGVEQVDVSRC
jgi:hypothetical protein